MTVFFDSFSADDIHASSKDGFHGVEIFFDFVIFQAVVWLAESDVDGILFVSIDELRRFASAVIFSNFFGGQSLETGRNEYAIFVAFERSVF